MNHNLIYSVGVASRKIAVAVTLTLSLAVTSSHAVAETSSQGELTAAQKEQLQTADEMDRTASRLLDERQYEPAIEAAEKNVALREGVYGKEHREITSSLYLLARLYRIQRRNQEARQLHERIVKICETAIGPDDPATASALNNLGFFLDGIGEYAAARPPYERALKIRDQQLGPEDPATITCVVNLAFLLNLQKKYAEAIPLYRRALKSRTNALGADHADTMFCMEGLAIACAGNGDVDEAQALYTQAVEICEQSFGEVHIRTANAAEKLADYHRTQGDPKTAAPLYLRVVKIHESVLESDSPATATVLNKLAFMYDGQQLYDEAEPLYERALEIRKKVLGPEHVRTLESMGNLAFLYNLKGRHQKALLLNQRILETRERLSGPNDPATINSITNLAFTYDHLGDYAQAEPLYVRSLALSDEVLGEEHPDTATAVGNLALFYNSQARYSDAEPLFRRAVAINEKVHGDDHAATATSLDNLAAFFTEQADYKAALPLHQRALKIYEQQLGPEHGETVKCLMNVANVYKSLGNYDAALPLFQRALAISEKVLGADHPDTANAVNNLAVLLRRLGNDEDAEPLYERAIRIREQSLGKDHVQTANALNNLALLYLSQDKPNAAESLLQRVLTVYETQLSPSHPSVARTLSNLAFLNSEQQKFEEAAVLSQRAVDLSEKSLGAAHPLTITAMETLGTVQGRLKHIKEATAIIDKARRGTRKHVTQTLPSLSEAEQTAFLTETYVNGLHAALSLALANPSDTELVKHSAAWLINGKAVAQEAMAQRNLLSRHQDNPELADAAKLLLQVRTQLAALAMSGASADQAEMRKNQVQQLTEQEQTLSQKLSAAGGSLVAPVPDWVERQTVQQSLPEDGVLIDLARFEVFSYAKATDAKWQPARYVAWITRHRDTSPPKLIDLGDAEQIDRLVEAVRSRTQNAGALIRSEGEEAATAALLKELLALAEAVWWPLVPHLGSAENVVLSPDGSLWLAPWTALPTDRAGETFVVEKYTVRLAVSGRDLVTPRQTVENQPPVILANPRFDQQQAEKRSSMQAIFGEIPLDNDTNTRSFSAQTLVGTAISLPNTAIEAIAIRPNLEKYAGQEAILYTEQFALERVAKALQHAKVVSFATHGFFLPAPLVRPKDSVNTVGESSRSVPLDLSGQPIENPLLRCGLLLAGCNSRDSVVGDDDGFLTGLEIVGIDFRGTELVVLSACETGIGDVRNGEGVAGLRQAFQLAGAEAVVSTLWQVPDRDSALLMSKFFEELAAGKSKSEALRNAQLERIEKRRERYGAAHPFYWAAFTLTGN